MLSAEINGGSEVVPDPRYDVNSEVGAGLLEDLAIGRPGCSISEAIGHADLIIVPGYEAAISEVVGLEGDC